MANDVLLKLLELSLAQPVSTAVADELPNMSRQQVSSKESPEYIKAGVPPWLIDMFMGGGRKGASILGRLLSKKKFPVGYGYPTEKAHSSINKLIKKAAQKTKKVEVSDYIPNQLRNIRANTPPNPNLSKIILRNDPSKIRK